MEWILILGGAYLLWRFVRRKRRNTAKVAQKLTDRNSLADLPEPPSPHIQPSPGRQTAPIETKAELDALMRPHREERKQLRRKLRKAEKLAEKLNQSNRMTRNQAQQVIDTIAQTTEALTNAAQIFEEVGDLATRAFLSDKAGDRLSEEWDGFSDLECDLREAQDGLICAAFGSLEAQGRIDDASPNISLDEQVYTALRDIAPPANGKSTVSSVTTDSRTAQEQNAVARKQKGRAPRDWNGKRDMLKPHAIILTALALSDSEVHEQEFEVITDHCEDLARRRGAPIGEDRDKLARYLRSLSPTVGDLTSAIERLASYSEQERRMVLVSSIRLIRSDGKVDPAETEFLADLKGRLRLA